MAYMFVHDGLVHRRFSVGPIANVPYFRRVAAAHKVSWRPLADQLLFNNYL
jgi:beta-carotene 3-hydroxylase